MCIKNHTMALLYPGVKDGTYHNRNDSFDNILRSKHHIYVKGFNNKNIFVRCGVRTHAILRLWELKSHALDHSANLTVRHVSYIICFESINTYSKTAKVPIHKNLNKKVIRCRQDSNLRGETPLDFKSNALTTRPRQLVKCSALLIGWPKWAARIL